MGREGVQKRKRQPLEFVDFGRDRPRGSRSQRGRLRARAADGDLAHRAEINAAYHRRMMIEHLAGMLGRTLRKLNMAKEEALQAVAKMLFDEGRARRVARELAKIEKLK